jgi:recombination protein RecA
MLNLNTQELAKLTALEKTFAKTYGDDYFGITQKRTFGNVIYYPTNSLNVNFVLGGRGIPEGRIIELAGGESSGKTTLVLNWIAKFQEMGKLCAFVDAEHAFDPLYAEMCGVKMDELAVMQPSTAEAGTQILRDFVDSGLFSFIVVDSVAGLSPEEEQNKTMEEQSMALLAKMMSRLLREVAIKASKNKCTLLFINQFRDSMSMYGKKNATSGGRALKYFSSVRLEMAKLKTISEKGKDVGITSKLTNIKNKVGNPFRTRDLEIIFPPENPDDFTPGETVVGIDYLADLVSNAAELGVLSGSTWLKFHSAKFGEVQAQGKAKMKALLIENPELAEEVRNACINPVSSKVKEAEINLDLEEAEDVDPESVDVDKLNFEDDEE